MQFTNLNKLVRLFLLGSCALYLLYLAFPNATDEIKDQLGQAGDGLSIPIGLVFLGLITALGSLVEGLAELVTSPFLKFVVRKSRYPSWLSRGERIVDVENWKAAFERAAKTPQGRVLLDFEAVQADPKSVGAAILHRHAPTEHVKYVDAHYWTFMLASALSILATLSMIPLGRSLVDADFSPLAVLLIPPCIGVPSICAFWVLAINNYLYTWLAVFRFSCLWLWKRGAIPPPELTEAPASNVVPPPGPACSPLTPGSS